MSPHRLLPCVAGLVVIACAATSAPHTSEPAATPAPTRLPDPEPAQAPGDAEPQAAAEPDPCADLAYVVSKSPLERLPLSDLVARTELVGTGKVSVNEADCSGIGWHHLAVDVTLPNNEKIEVYARSPLHGFGPPVKQYALVGSKRAPPRHIDLSGVCVTYDAQVRGSLEWVLPLGSIQEANQWRRRLEAGVCGRPGTRG